MLDSILISGYGWSGSGLLIDILKSNPRFYHFPIEIRHIKDEGGLIDLYQSKTIFKYAESINKFTKLSKVLSRKNGLLYGMNYNKLSGGSFKYLCDDFLNKLRQEATFKSDAFVFNYYNSMVETFFWKLQRKLDLNSRYSIYSMPPSIESLESQIIDFNLKFTKSLSTQKIVILDQAIDPIQWDEFKWMFPNSKMISIDRDPRDIYCDYQNSRDVKFKVMDFIEYFKKSRSINHITEGDYLELKFEDIIHNYRKTMIDVFSFVGEKDPFEFKYDLSKSLNNIGIHRRFGPREEIDIIGNKLRDFLWLD